MAMRRFRNTGALIDSFKVGTCELCGGTLQYSRHTKRRPVYCSDSCRQKAYRRRRENDFMARLGEKWRV
jgi:hypothetical protein